MAFSPKYNLIEELKWRGLHHQDMPGTEELLMKEMVGGYTMVKASDMNEAIKLAEGCPMFDMGGTVEVRDIMIFDQK